ncbi:MAG: hypothetical protein QOH04_1534 [Sphingomonadales bacterium]|jgi:hypothetical protein|nr:hypothetical protein [Sphingomonadales bacterium]
MSGGTSLDPGEIGGLFAGAVALIVAVGHGLRWWLGWTDSRQSRRAVRLQAWDEELKGRELRLDADRENEIRDIRGELDQMRTEHRALFQAYHLIARALVKIDPSNAALNHASALLSTAFKIDPLTPDDMAAMLGRLS